MSQVDNGVMEEKSGAEKLCDNVRYVFSTLLTLAALTVIVYAIGRNYAALPGHPALHYPLLVGVLTLLAYLEGLQVAILALERVDRKTFADRRSAWVCHRLATANRGKNVQRFLIGRQFFVVFVVFLCAQLTTYTKMQHELEALPKIVFVLIIETGFPGALIVLAFGQLMPQLVAATHPITFMGLPGSWSVIQLCLSFESTGVAHFAWVLASVLRSVFAMGDKEDITNPALKGTGNELDCIHEDNGDLDPFDKAILGKNMYLMDPTHMFSSCENGLANADQSDLNRHDVTTWLSVDAIRDRYGGSSERKLPDVPSIVRHLVRNNLPVPRYLLPPFHKKHIPPHIVCFELLRREEVRRKNGGLNVNTFGSANVQLYDDHKCDTTHTA